jgi:hypothetical protein
MILRRKDVFCMLGTLSKKYRYIIIIFNAVRSESRCAVLKVSTSVYTRLTLQYKYSVCGM